jgi:uncharacterized protein (TIGR02145 family)
LLLLTVINKSKHVKKVYTSLFLMFAIHSGICQVTDIEGTVYPTVIIGNQEWMAANLRVSMLNDSTPISHITNPTTWVVFNEPAMCWYNNDSAVHHAIYGRMYNGFAAMNPKICPDGWQVPTVNDWDEMINALGGFSVAGGKMKHVGTQYWEPPNTGATNSSGFTAYPNGWRSNTDGGFNFIRQRAGWFALAPGNSTAFRWVSWSLESAGTGAISEYAGLCIRCFRTRSNVSIEASVPLEGVKLFPNPSSGHLRIQVPGLVRQVIIRDLTGRILFAEQIDALPQYDLEDFGWQSGTYFVEITDQQGRIHTKKWLIQR